MNPEEYERLEAVEKEHWFYAGKRQIVFHWLRRHGQLRPEQLLVDCGAGTGRFVEEALPFCRAIAVDDHAESLLLARRRLGDAHVKEGSCLALPFADGEADAVTALDVIEHVPDDKAAVAEMKRIVKPGGVIVITVPAFMELWSDWDEALHHQRRYYRAQLRELLAAAGLEVILCQYINVFAFPAVYAIRKWRSRSPAKEAVGGERAEEKIPAAWMNKLLRAAFVGPACQTAWQAPFGVGLLAVARRRL